MSSVACLNEDANKSDLPRNVADFQPNIWGDYFLQYASESMVRKINLLYMSRILLHSVMVYK
jgi:hypothetical protein